MLFLAAFRPELLGLGLASEDTDVVGVGLVESGLGAARVIAARKPSAVVLVGTVGAYPQSGLAIGDVIVAHEIVLAAPSGALIEGAMKTSLTTDDALSSLFVSSGSSGDAKRARVATTLSITTEDVVARALEASTRAQVEHLEAFAVGMACAEANVPFTAVLGVANVVGSRGREEWRANHERASAAACSVANHGIRSRSRSRSPA